jgi:Co/Zn/Cd efflux system component
MSKMEQIVAATNAMLILRVSATVLHETIRKLFVATRTFGSNRF